MLVTSKLFRFRHLCVVLSKFEITVTGSHYHLLNPAKTGLVTIPMHSGEIVPPKTLQTILKQAGLTAEEFIKLL